MMRFVDLFHLHCLKCENCCAGRPLCEVGRVLLMAAAAVVFHAAGSSLTPSRGEA
jgi:hypothetical protein